MDEAIDLMKDKRTSDIFFETPTRETIKQLRRFLQSDPNRFIRLFHGTSAKHDVMGKGLLPTSNTRRNSYQSSNGYVCLTPFPSMARMFGEMAYPGEKVVVYEVCKVVRNLKPDKDQLVNKRVYSKMDLGSDLAASLVVGHAARVKGKISNMCICLTEY